MTFFERDAITQGFPKAAYDVVAWFEAIEHLSQADCTILMGHIKKAVGTKGVLVGSTPLVAEHDKGKGNWEHQNEFSTAGDLEEALHAHFAEVHTEVTVYPELHSGTRRTAYFSAKFPR